MEIIPGSLRAIQALPVNDRQGVDWWVEMESGERIAIDCKVRTLDPLVKYQKDDLALETWSVMEKRIIGWSLDSKKRTDYVLWIWKTTGRWCIVPFMLLVRAFKNKKDEWAVAFGVAEQSTDGRYHSQCIFVPRRDLWAEIYLQANGSSTDLRDRCASVQGEMEL